jgi:PhnB protein
LKYVPFTKNRIWERVYTRAKRAGKTPPVADSLPETKRKTSQRKPVSQLQGNTEEAFMFYKSVFGGEFSALLRFKDMPQGQTPVAEQEKERILHIALPIGEDTVLMGSDISESMGQKLTTGNNIYISLQTGSKEEAERLYNALSAGGKI